MKGRGRSCGMGTLRILVVLISVGVVRAADPVHTTVRIDTPLAPPAWALLERELLRAGPRLRRVLRPILRRPRLPSVRHAMGWRRRARRCDRECQRLARPVRAGRRRIDSRPVQEGLGRAPAPVHRGADDSGAVRARRDVLQRVPRDVRLAAPRRGTLGLQPRRTLRPPGCPVPAAGHALCRVLPRRRPRRGELRPGAQDHPQPLQRQPRPLAPQGDRARLGRRPDRGRQPIPPRSRRTELRADARAFQGL